MFDITKDPQAVLDYTFDWSGWLATGETISTAAVTVATGLTKDSESNDDTTVTVWLSGGTAGDLYAVTCQITTSAARTDERTLRVSVIDR